MAKRTQKFTDTIETGFIKVPSAILRVDISLSALKIYLYLLNNTAEWSSSIRQIQKETGFSNSGVQKGLKILEEKKMIEIIPGDHLTKNKYKFTRWFDDPLYHKTVHPCITKQYTPVSQNSTPPVSQNSTLKEEGTKKNFLEEKKQTALSKIVEDSYGIADQAVSKKRPTEELVKDAIKEEEMKASLDRVFQEAKRR